MSLAPDRDLFRNASDVAAALGISPYEKRAELLHRIKYGLEKDWSEWQQKMLLDKGNGIEALARPIAEALLGHPLPPRRFTSGKLGATLDGYHCDDALNSVNWECKTLNDAIRAAFNDTFEVEPGIKHNVRLPEYLCAQMEQQR